jgi:hypothetical protein
MVPTPQPRTLPLFDPHSQPQSWNERMADGEFAVLYTGNPIPLPPSPNDIGARSETGSAGWNNTSAGIPYCVVFSSLAAAGDFAAQQVALSPRLRCRIYDHHGLANPPLRELTGAEFKHESDLSPRLRRWIGSILLFGGMILFAIDWIADFRYGWPSMVGSRTIPTGLVLLFIDAGILLNRAQQRRKEQKP